MKKNIEKKGSLLSSLSQRTLGKKRSDLFKNSKGSLEDKINSFTVYSSRQNVAKLIAQYELVKETKNVLGDIIEAGVYYGSGLMGWANILASIEPYNYQCKIIGFDTFEGSKGVTKKDLIYKRIQRRDGEYNANSFNDLKKSIDIFNEDRPLAHLDKVKLVKGDIVKTSKIYAKENPAQAIRILHIGMNIYKPTFHTLKNFLPKMSKGSIVAIDGLNYATGGCMTALREIINTNDFELKTIDYYPNFSYFKL
tara:strand:- start:1049 stop:1804 length:756 start_codon:yes stop_codon:yes gene_type:complete